MGLFDFFNKNKNQQNKSPDQEFVSKNWREINSYWKSVITGEIKLKDKSKFDRQIIYNEKYLKYKIKLIDLASIEATKYETDRNAISKIRTCYMYIENFNNKITEKRIVDFKKFQDLREQTNAKKDLIILQKAYGLKVKMFDEATKK